MDLNIGLPDSGELKPRIMVFGVGGAGGNAVNNMIAKALDGVEFVVANTDAQALEMNQAENRLQLGEEVTQGLGAGAKPSVGQAAAEESVDKIVDLLIGSHMCFITAGMGGGTGTGAAPIIAQAARQLGILTVGVVTKPFQFEGSRRMRQAEEGIEELQKVVDTLIVIPNQNLFRLANEATTFTEAFNLADDVLYQGVKGVTDLMVRPGLINLDFADIRAVMDEMGKAMMGTGEADGDDRAVVAADRAIANPLLDEVSLAGARGVLINITGGQDMTLFELDEAANKIREEVDPDANIIVGSTLDPEMQGKIRVSVVATGIDARDERVLHEAEPQKEARVVAETHVADDHYDEPKVAAVASVNETWETQAPSANYQGASADIAAHLTQAPAAQAEPSAENNAEVQQRRLDEAVRAVPPTAPRAEETIAPQRQEQAPSNAAPSRGVSGLIERITGANHSAPRPQNAQPSVAPRPQTKTFVAPPAASAEPVDRMADEEQDRIDIPAFLRRQAN